jgi:hypothetical protein
LKRIVGNQRNLELLVLCTFLEDEDAKKKYAHIPISLGLTKPTSLVTVALNCSGFGDKPMSCDIAFAPDFLPLEKAQDVRKILQRAFSCDPRLPYDQLIKMTSMAIYICDFTSVEVVLAFVRSVMPLVSEVCTLETNFESCRGLVSLRLCRGTSVDEELEDKLAFALHDQHAAVFSESYHVGAERMLIRRRLNG